MKKTTIIGATALVMLGAFSIQSCKNEKNDDPTPQQASEFVADNSTFSAFENWSIGAVKNGVDPANLGPAHAGNDSSSQRTIYWGNSAASRSDNGQYPVGTIIAKKTTWSANGGGSMITAMAKRGNNFDASGNNWEYFILNSDGSVLVDNGDTKRGANLNNGGCKGCHGKVANNDYVFTR